MTTVDQAFLRAYRKAGEPIATRHVDAQAAQSAHGHPMATPWESTAEPSADALAAAAATPMAVAPTHQAHYYVDGAHAFTSSGWTGIAESDIAEHEPHAAAAASSAPRPLFEVPRFEWPALVEELWTIAPAHFEPLMAVLCAPEATKRMALVTSCHRQEGRSTTLLALAGLAAARGKRVALVDANFRAPQLAGHLGVLPQVDWHDVLAQDLPLEEALVESLADGLTLLPLAHPMPTEALQLGHRRLTRSLELLRDWFDLVLVEGEPLVDDAQAASAALLGWFDAAVVVRDVRRTSQDEIDALGRWLAIAGVESYSLIENYVRRVGA